MRRSPSNIIYHELIGLKVKILKHYDPSLEGVEGTVIWETSRTLIIRRSDKDKDITVLKPGALFLFRLGKREVRVKGENILGDPVERVKRFR